VPLNLRSSTVKEKGRHYWRPLKDGLWGIAAAMPYRFK
jgi:hypothetical protein